VPNLVYMELGFPILLVDPVMLEVRGQQVPDVNIRDLQATVFRQLIAKAGRLTGAEVRFIRKYLRLRQADLAKVLNMANHSVVSQWESREDEFTGMEYNTEVLLRVWMAAKVGRADRLLELLEDTLRDLEPVHVEPLAVTLPKAA
jgi:DNA-binding transcriptional regulator YiaG